MIDRVVLDVQLADAEPRGQAIGPHERREPRVQARARLPLDRQQLPVPPEVSRPALDRLAGHQSADGVVVVDHFQGPQTLVADPQRLGGKRRLTEMATKTEQHVTHS